MVWLGIEAWGGSDGEIMQIQISQNKILKKNWGIWKLLACKDEPVKI